jgi:hypothetical protein
MKVNIRKTAAKVDPLLRDPTEPKSKWLAKAVPENQTNWIPEVWTETPARARRRPVLEQQECS